MRLGNREIVKYNLALASGRGAVRLARLHGARGRRFKSFRPDHRKTADAAVFVCKKPSGIIIDMNTPKYTRRDFLKLAGPGRTCFPPLPWLGEDLEDAGPGTDRNYIHQRLQPALG